MAVGVGVAQDVRALDAATIRNPGATWARYSPGCGVQECRLTT